MSAATLIAVTAAGYFVDIYDLLLFSIVRVQSLKDLGLEGESLLTTGVALINLQMAGLLVGGLFWGILGDRRGRLAVLFGSILTYSIANLLNAAVGSLPEGWAIPAYGLLRFIAGIGLAGELGAAVTLVSEACSRERRGLATAFVASMGIAGAVFAGWVARHFHWTQAYVIGGVMGLLLLFTRVKMAESSLFSALEERHASITRGDWWSLLIERSLRPRYLGAIAQGMPIWFVVGVLLTFSPEIGRELRLTGEIDVGRAIMHCYGGAVIGDFLAGVASQLLRRRKAAIATFLLMTAAGMAMFVNFHDRSFDEFCLLAAFMGFASGYWAVLLSSTAEQFGTNLRSTVTSTVPNFIRATVIPMSTLFLWLGARTSLLQAAAWISGATLLLAAYCLLRSRETFGASLEFIEEPERTDAILFFDGECNLCNSVVDFCVRHGIAERRGVRFASLQGQTARERLPESLRGENPGTLVLLEGAAGPARLRMRSDAALQLLIWSGGFSGFLALCLRMIPRFLADAVYAGVARTRFSIWGRRDTCRMPRAEERSWFLA